MDAPSSVHAAVRTRSALAAVLAGLTLAPLSPALASWEDSSPSSPPAVRSVPAPRPSRSTRGSAVPVRGEATAQLYGETEAWGGRDFGPRYGEVPPELFCQTLDAEFHPLSFATIGYVPETAFGPFGESSTLEFDTALRMFAFEDFLAGYLEGFARTHLLGFLNDADIDALPAVAAHVALEGAASWRLDSGWSLELRAAPGIYSDIAAPQFNCLATANLHYSFTPTLAGVGGATVRPGWDLPVMPNLGFAWQPVSFFRVETMLPRSRVMLSPFRALTLFGTFEWRNRDYALEDEPGVPSFITLDEWLATAGILIRVTEYSHLSAEAGTFLRRELSADVAQNATLSLSEEMLVRVGWHGAF